MARIIMINKSYKKEGRQWNFHYVRKIKCMKSHNLALKEKQLKYGEMFQKIT
jgi:hypothetical protein